MDCSVYRKLQKNGMSLMTKYLALLSKAALTEA